jgi:phage terminase Nu1 subunit (DNA packaging protein)
MLQTSSISEINQIIDGQYERARLDKVRADREQLELDLARQNLVIRADVHNTAFEAARKLRDSLHSLCKQSAPNLVNVDDPAKIEIYLRDEVDNLLKEFASTCV